MPDMHTTFDYLLNAFELAAQSDAPANNGYAEKRQALFAYVREIEKLRDQVAAQQRGAHKLLEPGHVDFIADDGYRNAAGGIYATGVKAFAIAVQHAFVAKNGLAPIVDNDAVLDGIVSAALHV